MYFKTYKIEKDKLILREFFFFKNEVELNRILTAKQKKTHFLRKFFFGWPDHHIKIYIYPLDYYYIFTDEAELYDALYQAVKENPYAFEK